MLDDSLDPNEELIDDELCSYQSQIDEGIVNSERVNQAANVPVELQPELNEFRHCLDLIEKKRTQGNFPIGESTISEAWAGYALPSRIARFKIMERLGVGGFGIVFRGWDPAVGRAVAIKIPRAEFLGSPELADRFAREALAVAQLEHPNIVPVYEGDCYEVIPYIVMPYIPGKTLAQWHSDEGHVSPRTAAEIVRQLAVAVAHAHERGVLHRDLKPGNVLLAPCESVVAGNGLGFVPKLTDFGLAKCVNSVLADTRTGSMIGTARYMSPEQAEGRNRDITARSDVYGLGVILYELLAGSPPFSDSNNLQTIHKILRDDPPSFRALQIKAPIDLEVICMKCLEKSPSNRYRSASALADDLQSFLNGEPIRARPISLFSRMVKWSRRHPKRAIVMATNLLTVVILVIVSLWYNFHLSVLRKVAEFERRSSREHEMVAKRRAYVSDMRNAKIIGDHDNVGHMLKLLDRYRPRPGEPDIRDFAWWEMWREYSESSRVLGMHGRETTSVAITQDGRLAASGGLDDAIRIWSLPDGKLIGRLHSDDNSGVKSVSFSPNGKRLVSAGQDGAVRIWNLESFEQLCVCGPHPAYASHAVYSPEGDIIASAGADHRIRLWHSETGEEVGVLTGHSDSVLCLAFHPIEPLLVSGGKDAQVRFWDWKQRCPDSRIKDGSIQLASSAQWPQALAIEPNGKSLQVGTPKHELIQFSLDRDHFGERLGQRHEKGNPTDFAWCRDGTLITAFGTSEIHISDRLDPSLPGEWKRGHQRPVVSIAVSADGSSMVSTSQDGEVRYWPDLQRQSRINIVHGQEAPWPDSPRIHEVQWRDQYLAADFQQRQVELYRMPDRTLARTFAKANEESFVLSPSGKVLLIFQLNGLVTAYRTDDGKSFRTLQLPARSQGFFTDFCMIDKADRFVVIASDNDLLVISLESSDIQRKMNHPERVWQLAISDTENFPLVVISACNDGYIRHWDVGTGTLNNRHRVNHGPTYSVAVSEDRKLIATAGDDHKLRVWRFENMAPVVALPCNEPPAPARIGFLKGLNGSEILARQNFGLSFWGINDETELLAFPDCGQFGPLAVSPDRNQLAIPQNGWIRLIDGRPESSPGVTPD